MRRLSLVLAIVMAFSSTSAVAATKKPSPRPTIKATAKATAKPAATSKSTSKPNSVSKATVKPKPKPKRKIKRKPRKKIKVTPSPQPAWPPVGFPPPESGVYAKVPTRKELVGVISAKGNLAAQVAACRKFVCGAVRVAAEQGCIWWEVDSQVFAQNKELLGNLKTVINGSASREVKTILLISPEPLETMEYIDKIDISCHQDVRPEGLQAFTFTKVG